MLAQFWQNTLDLIFPPQCSGCDRVGWVWCPVCDDDLRAIPLPDLKPLLVRLPPLRVLAATGTHEGPLADAVRALKYQGAQRVALPLGERLVTSLRQLNWTFDRIVPVPLHSNRLKQRGYNQATQLASVVAQAFDRPCTPDTLRRQRDTPPQVGLNREQRHANVRDAFIVMHDVKGQVILLVDDVRTTGATLQACAQALHSAAAKAVMGITVTTAPLNDRADIQHSYFWNRP